MERRPGSRRPSGGTLTTGVGPGGALDRGGLGVFPRVLDGLVSDHRARGSRGRRSRRGGAPSRRGRRRPGRAGIPVLEDDVDLARRGRRARADRRRRRTGAPASQPTPTASTTSRTTRRRAYAADGGTRAGSLGRVDRRHEAAGVLTPARQRAAMCGNARAGARAPLRRARPPAGGPDPDRGPAWRAPHRPPPSRRTALRPVDRPAVTPRFRPSGSRA